MGIPPATKWRTPSQDQISGIARTDRRVSTMLKISRPKTRLGPPPRSKHVDKATVEGWRAGIHASVTWRSLCGGGGSSHAEFCTRRGLVSGPLHRPIAPYGEDPYWFKRAVFYEVLVRSFHDSDADGVGDFQGLRGKLDYLEWLGVDCLWLPPFYPSPLRRSTAPRTTSRISFRTPTRGESESSSTSS